MSQATRSRVAKLVKSFGDSQGLPFTTQLDDPMVHHALAEEGVTGNACTYTPTVTLRLFLGQVIDPDHSCRAAVARLILWLTMTAKKPCAADTSTYCEARQRLPEAVIANLTRQVARKADDHAGDVWLWKGRRVTLVDGTTVSMPDTPANQQAYPQPTTQQVGLGFPLIRLVALISLATGVVRELAMGCYAGKETGETALFRSLWDRLESGEIVLGDRFFGSYFGIAGLSQRGVDGLFRMHQRRKHDFRTGRCLGVEDHVVSWPKPKRPEWMDQATYDQLPEELSVRELRITVDQAGFRVNELVLVTTLRDGSAYSKEEVAGLFLQRWHIELDFRSIKCVLHMDVLRCKTPAMVRKEIWAHLLASNLIRGVMAEAAREHGTTPRRLSFQGALQTLRAFEESLGRATPVERAALMKPMLKAIASHRVGDRFGRTEPRVNKRRPKQQRYMMEPRSKSRKCSQEQV